MKLNQLLEKITRLPWFEVSASDGDKWIGTDQGDDRIETLDGNTHALDHTYLVHAANVLPELYAAAKNLEANWERNLTQPMARLHEALAIAEEVNEEPGPAKRTSPKITQKQEQAVRQFIESWNLSMPYHDIGSALNCGECNALHEMLIAFGAIEAAQALIEAHVAGDEEGDDLDHLRIKAGQESRS